MASYSFTGLIGTGIPAFSTSITDLEVAWVNGVPRLYSANLPGPGAGYAAYDLSGTSGVAPLVAVQGYSAPIHHLGAADFLIVPGTGGGAGNLIAAGVTPSGWASYHMTAAGGFGTSLDTPFAFNPVAVTGYADGGANYVYFAVSGSAVPLAFRLADSGAFTPVGATASAQGGADQDDLTAARTGGGNYLLSVSATADTITSYAIAADGSLSLAGQISAQIGTGFSKPTEIGTLTLQGQSFAVVAASESSSLSVFRILPGGTLYHADHVVDSLTTRFANATALATLQAGDRGYVAVGGADGGVEIMTLLPDGRLIDLLTIADSAAMSLDHVSALSLVQAGGRTELFAASATEPGITQIDLALGAPGVTLWQQGGMISGGAGNDVLAAGSATTEGRGGGGDDLIIGGGAGGGALLFGGAGADRFILSAAAQTIQIMDYQPGIDRLDLTALPMLRNLGQMTITTTATGADLVYLGTSVHVESLDGNPIPVTAFAEAQMLPLTRYAPVATSTIETGSTGNDQMTAGAGGTGLLGLAGNDILTGGVGDDLLDGDTGNDTLNGNDGNDRLFGGQGDDLLAGGAGNDVMDGGDGRDQLTGDAGDDTLTGGAGDDSLTDFWADNYLDGGAGNDRLYGGAGNDALVGGDGNDYVVAGAGNDSLWGGLGNDALGGEAGNDVIHGDDGDDAMSGLLGDDQLYGDNGNDLLWDTVGNDTLYGGADNDTLYGGDGYNLLDGGAGNDYIYGGADADWIVGGTGNDAIAAGGGNDTIIADAGNDWIRGGTGADLYYGGAGADTFAFGGAAEIGLWGTADFIEDFTPGQDKISFAGMGLTFGSRGVAREIHTATYGHYLYVYADVNGDGQTDFSLFLDNVASVSASDFIL